MLRDLATQGSLGTLQGEDWVGLGKEVIAVVEECRTGQGRTCNRWSQYPGRRGEERPGGALGRGGGSRETSPT